MQSASEAFAEAVSEDDDLKESIVEEFAEQQRKILKDRFTGLNSDDESVLDYVNETMEFLFDHLDTGQLLELVKGSIFAILEEELLKHFNDVSQV